MPFDAEFADGVLQRELPHSIERIFKSKSSSCHRLMMPTACYGWCGTSPCVASGIQPIAWELGGGILTASCDVHVTLLRWLMTTSRWRRSDGRDFVFIVEDPRWQLPFGSGSATTQSGTCLSPGHATERWPC